MRSEGTGATAFARSDVVKGAIAIDSTTIVQWLAGGADIAIVFGFVSETLRPKVRDSSFCGCCRGFAYTE